jgi:hypothetical protein
LSFSSSEQLFTKLVERYQVPTGIDAKQKFLVQTRVVAFLKEWLDTDPEDVDSTLLRKIQKFAKETLSQDGHESQSKNLVVLIEKKFNKRQTMPVTKLTIPAVKVENSRNFH